MTLRLSRVSAAVAAALAAPLAVWAAPAADEPVLSPVVVTAPQEEAPLKVVTDPKQPRQPIPAHDGADFLKTIPGFSEIRKGGTDGDPVFRGMSGSRLGILLDGQEIYGGCGGRMDPPTAYVYPESYDRVTVLKGPQTVRYGAGMSAAVVLFERDIARFRDPGVKFNGSLTVGSFGRRDEVADLRAGSQDFYVQASGTHAHADNYKDGDGKEVNSRYTRWNASGAVGWTPDNDTRLELSMAQSDGRAAYADRTMDGSKFARENLALRFEKARLSSLVQKVEALAYYNHIDHVMDNYSLRPQPAAGKFAAMNPDRTTTGGRFAITLTPLESLEVVLGADGKSDQHRIRSAMMKANADAATAFYEGLPYKQDMRFGQFGLFSEATYHLAPAQRIVGGLRVDWHEAKDSRPNMYSPATSPTNTTLGKEDRKTLGSGFLRYEQDLQNFAGRGTYYVGLGHVERFADYWERLEKDQDTGKSVFLSLRPEKTTQLDAGVNWKGADWNASVSGFAAKINDYLLINWDKGLTRNVDATTLGGEAEAGYQLAPNWKTQGTLAYVWGRNDTDGKPLAQQPPLEFRWSLLYDNSTYSFGALWRVVAAQHRYDLGSGNIVMNGKDIGPSGGFSVFSLNAGWKPHKTTLVTAGVDNLFNRTYAEFLSRTGSSLPGFVFPPNTRINEPGRTFWLKAQIAL